MRSMAEAAVQQRQEIPRQQHEQLSQQAASTAFSLQSILVRGNRVIEEATEQLRLAQGILAQSRQSGGEVLPDPLPILSEPDASMNK